MLNLVPLFSLLVRSCCCCRRFFCQSTSILPIDCCDYKTAAKTYIYAILGRSKLLSKLLFSRLFRFSLLLLDLTWIFLFGKFDFFPVQTSFYDIHRNQSQHTILKSAFWVFCCAHRGTRKTSEWAPHHHFNTHIHTGT